MVEEVENGKTPQKVQKAIILSIAATAAAVGAYYFLAPKADNVETPVVQSTVKSDETKLFDQFAMLLENRSQSGFAEKFDALLKSTSPDKVRLMIGSIAQLDPGNPLRRHSAEIAERAGLAYKNPQLMSVSSSHYRQGVFSDPDFEKAKSVLEHPFMQNDPLRDLYIGLVYMDKRNPGFDKEQARMHFERARDGGLGVASEQLLKLDAL